MIGLLNAYQFDPDPKGYQTEYEPMTLAYLNTVLPGVKLKSYRVGLGEWPQSVKECEGWIISGSGKSAYDTDDWILRLGEFVRECDRQKQKILGICFGHQLIAHALGGRTEKSPRGWGIGVQEFSLIQPMEALPSWMTPQIEKCSLIFSHQDQVVQLPPKATLHAKSEFCPIQIYSIEKHVFSIQGHPEVTPEFARGRMDARIHLLGEQTYKNAVQTVNNPTHDLEVGKWIRNFFSK